MIYEDSVQCSQGPSDSKNMGIYPYSTPSSGRYMVYILDIYKIKCDSFSFWICNSLFSNTIIATHTMHILLILKNECLDRYGFIKILNCYTYWMQTAFCFLMCISSITKIFPIVSFSINKSRIKGISYSSWMLAKCQGLLQMLHIYQYNPQI